MSFSKCSFGSGGMIPQEPITSKNPWRFITPFTLELMVEKVLTSAAPMPLSPGDAVRRVFESIAGNTMGKVDMSFELYLDINKSVFNPWCNTAFYFCALFKIGGLLLPDSPGLLDPCEKEPHDAFANLSSQQREDITAAAQHTLRLIAFRQVIHPV